MADLILKTQQELESDGLSVSFWDRTGTTASNSYGQGGNITYADVDAVRIKIADQTTLADITTIEQTESFVQFTEYIKTAGSSSTVDGKTMVIGSIFVPQLTTFTVPSGDTWETTGYYVPQIISSWLPTATEVALNLDINELGQSGSLVEDNIYAFDYSVFIGVFSGTQAAVDGNTYLVMTSTATYGGNTYRFGETFVATSTANIVAAGNVGIMEATSTQYAVLAFALELAINASVAAKGSSFNQNYYDQVYGVKSQLNATQNASASLNVSFPEAYDILLMLTDKMVYLDNNTI